MDESDNSLWNKLYHCLLPSKAIHQIDLLCDVSDISDHNTDNYTYCPRSVSRHHQKNQRTIGIIL